MNFQEKLFENTAALRARAAAFASLAIHLARARAQIAATTFGTLTVAGREMNKLARRHAVRFVKENSTIAVEASKDVSAVARTTYATLTKRPAAPRKARKAPAARKRAARKVA